MTEQERAMEPRFVCSKCGETSTGYNLDDWLVASVPESRDGEMVIRCPEHITEYSVRKAGGHIESRAHGRVGIVGNWEYDLVG